MAGDKIDRSFGTTRYRGRRRRMGYEKDDLSDGDESDSFLSQVRQNPFLEKEERYKRENIELEKKSTQLFEKIDKFTSVGHPR
jgi:hypothetical protein